MDSLLSQMYPAYLTHLIAYNKVLIQRNSLLKNAAESGNLDTLVLEVLDEQLIDNGLQIFEFRKNLMIKYLPAILKLYNHLAGGNDAIDISYQSPLNNQNFKELLSNSLSKDRILQRTSIGIHKDDLIITIQNHAFKQEASQGQRKSLLFSIRLAEWELIKEIKGFSPTLLMDDIFEKLDEERMKKLLAWVSEFTDGQVFITDTHKERVANLLGTHLNSYQLIEL
jgi:DNA replication and repair protein RecF